MYTIMICACPCVVVNSKCTMRAIYLYDRATKNRMGCFVSLLDKYLGKARPRTMIHEGNTHSMEKMCHEAGLDGNI